MHRVYLDMNHLIILSKQRKAGNTSLFDRLISLKKAGGAVFPISAAHLMETASINKGRQRRDLADIIYLLSDSWVLRPMFEVMRDEVFERVAQHYGRPCPPQPLSERVLVKGFLHVLGELNKPILVFF